MATKKVQNLKEKSIQKEKKKLKELIKTLPEEIQKANEPLIENLAFTIVMISDLKQEILTSGVREEYQNGENQKGYKESTYVKTYNTMIKNYITMMKTLNSILQNIDIDNEDELEEFRNS